MAQHCGMWERNLVERQHHCQANGDSQTNLHTDENGAQKGGPPHQKVEFGDPPQKHTLLIVKEGDHRCDHDRAQYIERQMGEHACESQEHQAHDPRGHELGQGTLATSQVIDCRPAEAACGGVRRESGACKIGEAQTNDLKIVVELVAILASQSPGDRSGLKEVHHHDDQGGGHELSHVLNFAPPSYCWRRQAAGNAANNPNALLIGMANHCCQQANYTGCDGADHS
mmetsp:Transcript_17393/g.29825  ORF Transcript_17393/g.29825 Transcript_17393/m.29825 type:complete len:227 (+) Transcript_17393:1431-2111(+)